jgi:DNA-binding winged helix-turn-helix (wHTH) protein
MSSRNPQFAPRVFRSGPFSIDLDNRELLRDERAVPLAPKVFDTLAVLVANAGRIVSKEELMREVWPDTIVEEANLTQNVFTLRRALADAEQRTYIETVPRRGYRFVVPVEAPGQSVVIEERRVATVVTEEEEVTVTTAVPARRLLGAAGVAAAVIVTALSLVFAGRGLERRADRLDRMQLRLVTTAGTALDAAISPDGRFVAYVSRENGGNVIRLRQLASTSSVVTFPERSTPSTDCPSHRTGSSCTT